MGWKVKRYFFWITNSCGILILTYLFLNHFNVYKYASSDDKFLNEKNDKINIKKSNNEIFTLSKTILAKNWKSNVWPKNYLEGKNLWNVHNLSKLEIDSLSIMGKRLFLHQDIGNILKKKFLILVYKHGKSLHRRLLKDGKIDPFEKCSANNCDISYIEEDFDRADAVLFHLHRLERSPSHLKRTNYNQRWVWMSDESPFNTFMLAKDKRFSHYDGLFNWSMTYRYQSDVPVPYGRFVPLLDKKPLIVEGLDYFSQKSKDFAIMGSNCHGSNNRWLYIKYLKEYLNIDVYGRCGTLTCTSSNAYRNDCPLLNDYKFYFAFENSNCKQYITEKAWWHAFEKGAVPVVMGGASKEDYLKLFPPNSFIYVEDFESPKELAELLLYLSKNSEAYNAYHSWRTQFEVVNEHGYFGADIYHYCRLCEALNYNGQSHKTYSSFKSFWDPARDCSRPKWKKPNLY